MPTIMGVAYGMITWTFAILVALIAIEHLYIFWFEMFAWETKGKKIFKNSLPEHLFAPTKKLAANQGLYNAFLAAGLILSLFVMLSDRQTFESGMALAAFFLCCVLTAGIYGGISSSRRIFFIQGLPALIALLICAVLYANY